MCRWVQRGGAVVAVCVLWDLKGWVPVVEREVMAMLVVIVSVVVVVMLTVMVMVVMALVGTMEDLQVLGGASACALTRRTTTRGHTISCAWKHPHPRRWQYRCLWMV